ncbi:MarR family transcriptional regulator [Clostridium sp. 19966]|uniref:MarR family winged helix-turn-helix transcriptional regulator n=1 Tax=Clostridium sp. 19966 TaxID=2768166 RepID=UPI0028DFAABD|nr:MarR family transcriptional regulator [Clostridium sp. 19966]MDT8717725.1 MarR family transcriptional regulator [Clostridium sp. 19966]
MKKAELLKNKKYIFGALFIASNRIDTLMEREFAKFDITTKQWFLSIILDNLFDKPPTIKELAKQMGSSHQNVKQIALKLEQKGLLSLEKDSEDARATRLKLTENAYEFWDNIRKEGNSFTKELFKDIAKEDLAAARRVMEKLLSNIDEMDNK